MNTEKKWVDYLAEFCTYHARMQAHIGHLPRKDLGKEGAIEYLNWMVTSCMQVCKPESVPEFRRLLVNSQSVTWRSLAARIKQLCELWI
jgi:hypothetical protein